MDTDTAPSRSDALARAAALATRARELRRAQMEVQDLTAREVQVLARTAASFFDTIPLPEFSTTLLPQSARTLRRIRHRILHRTIHTTETGTLIRAMLLGRDGALRLFSARSADSRDLLLIMEPGRTLPATVMRDITEWTPTQRVPGFRPFEMLEKLSGSLDVVEEQIATAEQRVQVQKAALASGASSRSRSPPPSSGCRCRRRRWQVVTCRHCCRAVLRPRRPEARRRSRCRRSSRRCPRRRHRHRPMLPRRRCGRPRYRTWHNPRRRLPSWCRCVRCRPPLPFKKPPHRANRQPIRSMSSRWWKPSRRRWNQPREPRQRPHHRATPSTMNRRSGTSRWSRRRREHRCFRRCRRPDTRRRGADRHRRAAGAGAEGGAGKW